MSTNRRYIVGGSEMNPPELQADMVRLVRQDPDLEDAWPSVIAAVRDLGLSVEDDADVRYSGLPFEAYGASILVFLGDDAGRAAVGAIVTAIVSGLLAKARRRPKGVDPIESETKRYGVILGPDGKVLRRFELPDSSEEEPRSTSG